MMRRVLCVLVASVCVWSAGCTVKEERKPYDPSTEKQAKEDSSVAQPADTTASQQPAKDAEARRGSGRPEALKTLESPAPRGRRTRTARQSKSASAATAVDESFLTALARLPRLKTVGPVRIGRHGRKPEEHRLAQDPP